MEDDDGHAFFGGQTSGGRSVPFVLTELSEALYLCSGRLSHASPFTGVDFLH